MSIDNTLALSIARTIGIAAGAEMAFWAESYHKRAGSSRRSLNEDAQTALEQAVQIASQNFPTILDDDDIRGEMMKTVRETLDRLRRYP